MALKETVFEIVKNVCQAEYDRKRPKTAAERLANPATPRAYGLTIGEIVSIHLEYKFSSEEVSAVLNELVEERLITYCLNTDRYVYSNISVL